MSDHHLDGLLLGQRGLVPLGMLIQLLRVPGIPFCVVVKGKTHTKLLSSVHLCIGITPLNSWLLYLSQPMPVCTWELMKLCAYSETIVSSFFCC